MERTSILLSQWLSHKRSIHVICSYWPPIAGYVIYGHDGGGMKYKKERACQTCNIKLPLLIYF